MIINENNYINCYYYFGRFALLKKAQKCCLKGVRTLYGQNLQNFFHAFDFWLKMSIKEVEFLNKLVPLNTPITTTGKDIRF